MCSCFGGVSNKNTHVKMLKEIQKATVCVCVAVLSQLADSWWGVLGVSSHVLVVTLDLKFKTFLPSDSLEP